MLSHRNVRSCGRSPSRRHSKSPSGPVSRILSPLSPGPRSFLWARGRPRAQAADPETARPRRIGTGALRLPIWPCSAWGLPCPRRCRRGGALLPHRFTLAVRSRKSARRFVFCGTFLRVAATGHYPACRPFGVRTFLPDCLGAITWPARSRGDSISPGSYQVPVRSRPRSSFEPLSTSTFCGSPARLGRGGGSEARPEVLGRQVDAPASRTRRASSRSAVTTMTSRGVPETARARAGSRRRRSTRRSRRRRGSRARSPARPGRRRRRGPRPRRPQPVRDLPNEGLPSLFARARGLAPARSGCCRPESTACVHGLYPTALFALAAGCWMRKKRTSGRRRTRGPWISEQIVRAREKRRR